MSKLTVRRAIILILAAAACVLVVPGMAGAQVRAKYRAEYKASLNDLKNVFKHLRPGLRQCQGRVHRVGHHYEGDDRSRPAGRVPERRL